MTVQVLTQIIELKKFTKSNEILLSCNMDFPNSIP